MSGGRRRGLRRDRDVQVIALQINGKSVELERATPLLAYLEKLGVNPRAIAVEHNGTIIERTAYEAVTLKDGDTVEIVRMVGGGLSRHRSSGHPRVLWFGLRE
jgi:sulfur carrier protein